MNTVKVMCVVILLIGFDQSDANDEVLGELDFNYSNITLPDHYLNNDFQGNAQFQRAAIEMDNTPVDNPITDAGAALGRVLFYDKTLSGNGTTACASCHLQEHGFSDPNVLSIGFEGGLTRRHSMGLTNARFYNSGKFFWDERAATLEDQVLMPFQDQVEMGLTLSQLQSLVESQPYYTDLFINAFGDDVVTVDRISKALAQFVRSMVSITSRYDQARVDVDEPVRDFPSFTDQENEGKRLFYTPRTAANGATATCSSCHASEAFVGAIAANQDATTDATVNGLDAVSTDDLGVAETTGMMRDEGKFKVPSLRNVAVRPPYMHDGRLATLEAVIDHYSTGIQLHDNLRPPLLDNQGNAFRFNYTDEEKAALLAFLNTLTDVEMLTDEKFSNPFVQADLIFLSGFESNQALDQSIE